jgi:hypothetical protein
MHYERVVMAAGVWLWSLLASGPVVGDLILLEPGKKAVVDFGSFTGAGFSPSPGTGQLDSTTWRVSGLSDGSLAFGDTGETGDFARGRSAGGVGSGGVYAFQVASGDWALGVQPTGSDFSPGFFELRIQNALGAATSDWEVGYDLYTRNDQNRSSGWDLAYSTDGASFIDLPALAFTSPQAADSTNFVATARSAAISANVLDGENFYLRWTSRDVAGSGSRDEFALDNVSVTANTAQPAAVPEPGSLTLLGVGLLGLLGYSRRRRLRGNGADGGGAAESSVEPRK